MTSMPSADRSYPPSGKGVHIDYLALICEVMRKLPCPWYSSFAIRRSSFIRKMVLRLGMGFRLVLFQNGLYPAHLIPFPKHHFDAVGVGGAVCEDAFDMASG